MSSLTPAVVDAMQVALIAENWVEIMLISDRHKQKVQFLTHPQTEHTPVHLAALRGRAETVHRLVTMDGADKDEVHEPKGYTPLHLAAQAGSVDVVKLLLTLGAASQPVASSTGFTPLMQAASEGHVGVVRFLTSSHWEVDVNRVTPFKGSCALIEAAGKGHSAVVQALIEKGANVNLTRRSDGRSALAVAAWHGQLEVVKILIASGANVNAVAGERKESALHFSLRQGHIEVGIELVAAGGDLDQRDTEGITPMSYVGEVKVQRDRLWNAQPKEALEEALGKALSMTDIDEYITEDLLKSVLKPSNVTSLSTFFCGHNLLLLAIRCGVITRKNATSFGGTDYFFVENLYAPVALLHLSDAEKRIAKRVLRHAEDIGIIASGSEVVVAMRVAEASRASLETVQEFVVEMSRSVCSLQRKMDGFSRWADEATAKINEVSHISRTQRQDILGLSSSLEQLHGILKRHAKVSRRVGIACAALSFIPVVGSVVGNTAFSVAEIFLGMTGETMVENGVNAAKGALTAGFSVDLSNFKTAKLLMSKQFLGKLDDESRRLVEIAITNSPFGDIESLETALSHAVDSVPSLDGIDMQHLDSGSDEWLKGPSHENGPGSSGEGPRLENTSRVDGQFNLAVSLQSSDKLTFEDGMRELRLLCAHSGCTTFVSDDVLLSASLQACPDPYESLMDLATFRAAFAILEQKLGLVRYKKRETPPEFQAEFEAAAGSADESLWPAVAVRVLMSLWSRVVRVRSGENEVLSFTSEREAASLADAKDALSYYSHGNAKVSLREFILAGHDFFFGEVGDRLDRVRDE